MLKVRFISVVKKWRTNKAFIVGPLVLAGFTLSFGIYIWSSQQNAWGKEAAQLREAHTHEVLLESGRARSALQDLETGQRGYLITRRSAYLEPYNAGLPAFKISIDRLALLTLDDASQQARIGRLREVTANKLAELSATIVLGNNGDLPGALAIVATDRGKVLMDAARVLFKAIDAEERTLLKTWQEASEAEDRRRQFQILVLSAVSCITLLSGGGGIGYVFHLSGKLQSAAALAVLEARYQAIVMGSADAIVSVDPDYVVQTWNGGAQSMYGWSAAETIGRSFVSLIIPEDKRSELKFVRDEIDAGRSVHIETIRLHKNGRWIDASIAMAPLFENGKLVAISSVARDMTEHRRADEARRVLEAELRNSEAQLQLVISAADLAIWHLDLVSKTPIARSLRHDQMFGYEQLQARWGEDIAEQHVLEEDKATFRQGMKIARESGALFFEVRVRWPDGSVHWISPWGQTYYDGNGRPVRMAGVIRDVTVRKEADAALHESEGRLQMAAKATGLGIIDRDLLQGQYTWTDQLWRLLGLEPGLEPPSAAIWLSAVHPDDLAMVTSLRDVTWNDPSVPFDLEHRVVWPDGSVHWLKAQARALLGSDHQPVRAVCAMFDITENRQNEAALRRLTEEVEQREARLCSILETIPDGLALVDDQGIIHSFSATAEKLFGWKAEEAIGSNVSMLMEQSAREDYDSYLGRYFATGERRMLGAGRIPFGQRKNGSTFPLELSVGEVQAGGRRQFTCFIRDLTERTATQARLQRQQMELAQFSRLHAAGAMASALAHELNQPLTATISAVRAARRMLTAANIVGLPQGLERAMDLAADQALRAGQIVQHLREFVARGGEADKRPESLKKLVVEAHTLALIGLIEVGMSVVVSIAPDLPLVMADRVQIQQVLVNLIRNAAQAMMDQGTNGHRGVVPRRDLCVTASLREATIVELAVADTGSGLSPNVLERLFEPFNTTKPDGMGVGLSICRQIIEAHGGRLWAEPNPGGGAVFRFTLEAVPLELETGPLGPRAYQLVTSELSPQPGPVDG